MALFSNKVFIQFLERLNAFVTGVDHFLVEVQVLVMVL